MSVYSEVLDGVESQIPTQLWPSVHASTLSQYTFTSIVSGSEDSYYSSNHYMMYYLTGIYSYLLNIPYHFRPSLVLYTYSSLNSHTPHAESSFQLFLTEYLQVINSKFVSNNNKTTTGCHQNLLLVQRPKISTKVPSNHFFLPLKVSDLTILWYQLRTPCNQLM